MTGSSGKPFFRISQNLTTYPSSQNLTPIQSAYHPNINTAYSYDYENDPELENLQLIDFKDAQKVCDQIGSKAYVETSAKENININELFELAARCAIQFKQDNHKRWKNCKSCSLQ